MLSSDGTLVKSTTVGALGLTLALGFSFALGLDGQAVGQTIGKAAVVRNDVARLQGPKVTQINVDDDVFRNELVRTGSDSVTKLVFSDSTNLAVGPGSTVKLDTFVFAGDGNYKKVSINLVRGAFRFTTGDSAKRAYKISTPVATIGVRGTVLDIFSGSGRTIVTLVEDGATVCTRSGSKCLSLTHPGDTVIVTANSIRRSGPGAPNDVCQDSPDICNPTRFASMAAPTQVASDEDTPTDWSGFYAGGYGGYGGGASSQHDDGYVVRPTRVTRPATTNTTTANTATTTNTVTTTTTTIVSADGNYGLNGGIGGALFGYNFQVRNFVIGVEADGGGSSSAGKSVACGTPAHVCGSSLGAEGDIRGRFGFAYGSVLPYVTGGVAFQHLQAFDALTGASGSSTRTGYVVGGGVEYKLTKLVSLRVEYLHSGFGSAHLFDIVPGVPEQVSANSDVIRAGLSISLASLMQLGGH